MRPRRQKTELALPTPARKRLPLFFVIIAVMLVAFGHTSQPSVAVSDETHANGRYDGRATNQNSGAPRIVANGVKMHEVTEHEAGGFDIRPKGDDTYGKGELLAVSVEFNKSVTVNGNTTFRIQIGSVNRDLVPVSTRDNVVIFATVVQPRDNDSNGVWIGDNTSTLDHNSDNYIQSTGNSPTNANWTHSSPGTQSDHKVKGNAIRPRLREVRISSTPQFGDTYVLNEAIRLEARFTQRVRVHGTIAAMFNSRAFGESVKRDARYVEGNRTSKLVFEYVPILDLDTNGIAIPANSLAKGGDPADGAEGGGRITDTSGSLLADLSSAAKADNANHKIDVRLNGVPEVISSIQWDWAADTPDSASVEMDFNIIEDPGHFSEDHSLVLVLGWGEISGHQFAVGLRTDVDKPGTDGSQGKGIIFNRWGSGDASGLFRATGDGWVETGNFGGPFISLRRTFAWGEGNYSMRIAQDGDDDDDGRWFGFWITDKSTGVETKMGSLKFPLLEEVGAIIHARSDVYGSVMAIIGESSIKPADVPVLEAALGLPDASGGDEPNQAPVAYSLLGRGFSNANVRYDEDTGKIVMRTGGSTQKHTPAGTTLTGLATPLLTATTHDVPESHDGESSFTFELRFSEQIPLSYRTLRDEAFTVTRGSVLNARRLDKPGNIRWQIRVRPVSSEDVVVTLPVPEYCGATGAICTADGRELHETVEITVPGPDEND